MSNYRRCFLCGGTFFFTVVTHRRQPILTSELGREKLRAAFDATREKLPFSIVAMVLLPNHLHTVWTLPSGDFDYSSRWQSIKSYFSHHYIAVNGREADLTPSRITRRERAVWQRRFWEHLCRDEDDLKRCVDYIHWNPVKHKLAARAGDYPWSSFHRYVRMGEYPVDWGSVDPCPNWNQPE